MGRLDEARAIVERLRAITSVVGPDLNYLLHPEHRRAFVVAPAAGGRGDGMRQTRRRAAILMRNEARLRGPAAKRF
jgi:hypothetical protein